MLKIAFQTIVIWIRLCIFRGTPAELPYSLPLLVVLVLLSIGSIFLFPPSGFSVAASLFEKIGSLVILVGLLYWLLTRKKHVERLPKTLIAWFGTDLIGILLSLAIFGIQLSEQPNIAAAIFLVWLLFVKSYILKQTFDISLASAFFLLLGIMIPMSLPLMIILSQQLPT